MLFEVKEAEDKRLRRQKEWFGIICHHTDVGDRKEISPSLWATLSKNITEFLMRKDNIYVSAHFVIHRDGKIVQLVNPDTHEAFHAGQSTWFHPKLREYVSGWNQYAIGIELIGDGNLHQYTENQYNSLIGLCKYLIHRYPTIDPRCITGHENISPGRKIDPGLYFNWQKLFQGIYERKNGIT